MNIELLFLRDPGYFSDKAFELKLYYDEFIYKRDKSIIINNKEQIIKLLKTRPKIVKDQMIEKRINLYVYAIILKSQVIITLLGPLNLYLMIDAYNIITQDGTIDDNNYYKFISYYIKGQWLL